MNSRELVLRTLEFRHPARVPRQLWTLPWAFHHYPDAMLQLAKDFPDDIISAPGFLRKPLTTSGDAYEIGTYVDEWGCIFTGRQRGVIGEVKEPRIKTWDDLDSLRPPLESLTVDVEQVNAFCRASDKFIISGCCARPFERLQFLRGSENVYLELAEGNPNLLELLRRVHEFYLKELQLWADTEVDSLMFMDDWGAQRALLISPRMWRKLFKPLYKEYIDLAHSHGKKIFMHTDGFTSDILPDLVELGLDAINSQLFVMDIEKLGENFAGKITFWGELDRQYLLPFGTVDDITAAVRRVRNALYCNGGVIAQCEFGAGAKPENVFQMFKVWEEEGVPA